MFYGCLYDYSCLLDCYGFIGDFLLCKLIERGNILLVVYLILIEKFLKNEIIFYVLKIFKIWFYKWFLKCKKNLRNSFK